MGVRRKVFYPMAFAAMLFSSSAMAKINPLAFMGVTEFFFKDKSKNIDMGFYSPTLGEVALEAGLIENILFYGPFEAALDKNGQRDYTKDKSSDPLWNVAKLLFPSNNGQLGTTFDAAKNFARYVKNPKTVALLLNYAKQVEDVPGKGNLPPTITQTFAQEIFNTLEGVTMTPKAFSDNVIIPLLKHIRLAIEAEKKGTSLYPRHTTEQVIEAFFCYQFNTQEDIWKLIEGLDGSIVDKTKSLPTQANYLKEKDIPDIAAKPNLNLDDIFDLTQASIFTSPTPYRGGINLLNNGTTYFYDRTNNKYIKEETFQDCVETAMRHMCNLSQFDSLMRGFNVQPIKDFVAEQEKKSGIKNPYFENYKEFYLKQNFLMANAGDIGSRSLFNTVVGNLPNTIYRNEENTNEIKSGFINLLNTFNTVFGLSLKKLPTAGSNARKEWVEESLTTLFSSLNPTNTYTISLRASEFENELIGNAFVTVANTARQKNLFSFNLEVKSGHTEVNQFKILTNVKEIDYTKDIESHLNTLHKGTAEESLLLLASPELQQNIHPFYKLYSQPLYDNATKINFLKELGDNYESWKSHSSIKNSLPLIQSMVKNVMNNLAWDDDYVKQNIGSALLSLGKSTDFRSFLTATKELDLEFLHSSNKNKVSGELVLTENFNNLETLNLTGTTYLSKVSFAGQFENLRELKILRSGIEKLEGLENVPNIVELNLHTTNSLVEVPFLKPLIHLKWVSLAGSKITKLDGLENVPNLESLELDYTSNLSKFSLTTPLNHLKVLTLISSAITKLDGLENIPNVERINLGNTKELTELSFQNSLNHLKNVSFTGSGISKLEGVENLENLKELSLRNAKNIKTLKVGKENKDLVLRLQGSGIKSKDDIEGFEHLNPNNVHF